MNFITERFGVVNVGYDPYHKMYELHSSVLGSMSYPHEYINVKFANMDTESMARLSEDIRVQDGHTVFMKARRWFDGEVQLSVVASQEDYLDECLRNTPVDERI